MNKREFFVAAAECVPARQAMPPGTPDVIVERGCDAIVNPPFISPSHFDRELVEILTQESKLALLAGHFHGTRKPLTGWQRMKRNARLLMLRVSDAWDVLRGTAEVGES